ncbi:MAG: hypothetical protein ABSD29_10560 [Verrucomicrobiota bacterium]|jgi:hypothetical protein
MSKLKGVLRRLASRWDMVDPTIWTRHRPGGQLKAKGGVVDKGMPELEDSAVQRLLSAYRSSRPASHYGADSMWRGFFETRQSRMHDIFINGSISEARKVLSNPGESDLFYGFDNLFAEFVQRLRRSSSLRESYARNCLDDLLCFAEAVGALRCENPESELRSNSGFSAEDVLAKLENALGVRITFPNPYPAEFGLATSRGVASYRAIHALDLALRVRQLLKEIPSPKVLEIGAGLGRSAYFATRFGLPGYEIVDLPFTAISQGYFLISTLGADRVTLAGEAASDQAGCVRLTTPSDFLASSARYDLVVNVDSFTEIDPQVAQHYWQKVEASATRFLSINHEINPLTVKDLYDQSRRVKRAFRHPCWLRRGYVEELVEFV